MVFHLASLLLHTGSVCLAYIIIIRIFKQTKNQSDVNVSAIAFITALLFAVHPMNVESVAWVSASKIMIYAFFYLLATYTYIIYLDRKKTGFYILTLLLFTLSFGGKEQAVLFPVWLLMLYWLLGYSFKARKLWFQLTPFFALAFVFGVVFMSSQAIYGFGALSNEDAYPFWQRIVLGCYSLFEYLAKFLFPYKLLYIYPFPTMKNEPLHEWMLLYPVLIVIIITALWKFIKQKPVAAGLLFFLIHIAIVLHIIPLSRAAIIADRYIYLSSIGLSFIIAYYLVRFTTNRKGLIRNSVISVFVCILFYLGIYANLRSREWKDTESIKKDLREIIKQRDDYVPEELEKMMQEEKKIKNYGLPYNMQFY